MDDEKLKQLLQDDLEREEQQIMEEIQSDPSLAEVEAPQEIHDKLFQQIREYEEEKSEDALSEEQKELMRLGKIYRRKRKRNKYLVVAAAAIAVLAIGITSFGGPVKIVETVKQMVLDRERTNIDADKARSLMVKVANEEEACQLIEDTFGCVLVRMDFLPEDIEFKEAVIEEEKQSAKLFYVGKKDKIIVYTIFFNYRSSSIGFIGEDQMIDEFTDQVMGRDVLIKQYEVEDGSTRRWRIEFKEGKMAGFIAVEGLKRQEIDEIVKNLHFFK